MLVALIEMNYLGIVKMNVWSIINSNIKKVYYVLQKNLRS